MSATEVTEDKVNDVTNSLESLSIDTDKKSQSNKKQQQSNKKQQQSNQKQQQPKQQQQQQKKPLKTVYWGIEVNIAPILAHEPVAISLTENPQLVPLKKMHTTLLFVGRKEDERDKLFLPYKDQMCQISVNAHGLSQDALALRVSKLEFVDDTIKGDAVPAYPNIAQHVTVALKDGVKAVESVKSFAEGVMVDYDSDLVLTGKLTQYFF